MLGRRVHPAADAALRPLRNVRFRPRHLRPGHVALVPGQGSVRHDPRARAVRPPREHLLAPARAVLLARRGPDLPARRAGVGAGERRDRGLPARPRPPAVEVGRRRARSALLLNPTLSVAHVGVLPSGRGRDRSAAVRVLGRARTTLAIVHASRPSSPSSAKRTSRSPWRSLGVLIFFRGDRRRGAIVGGGVDDLLLLRHPGAHPGAERHRARSTTASSAISGKLADRGRRSTPCAIPPRPGTSPASPTARPGTSTCWRRGRSCRCSTRGPCWSRPAPSSSTSSRRSRTPRLPVPLLRDRRRRLRGGDRRGDRLDLERGPRNGVATQAAMVSVVLVVRADRELLASAAPSYSRHYHDGTWPLQADPTRGAARAEAVKRRCPRTRSPASAYNIDTHMTHRAEDLRVPGAVVQHQLGCAGRAPRRPGRACSTCCARPPAP